jgi:hypothetical protein
VNTTTLRQLDLAARRRGELNRERSRLAAARARSRRPTPSERPASGRCSHRSAPGRSGRSPPHIPDAFVRLAAPANAAFECLASKTRRHSTASKADPIGVCAPVSARCWSQPATCVKSAVARNRVRASAHRTAADQGRRPARRTRREDHRSTRVQARTNPGSKSNALTLTLSAHKSKPSALALPAPRRVHAPPPQRSPSRAAGTVARPPRLSTRGVMGANGAATRRFTCRPQCQAGHRRDPFERRG